MSLSNFTKVSQRLGQSSKAGRTGQFSSRVATVSFVALPRLSRNAKSAEETCYISGLNTRVSHSLLGSRQVGIVLSVPVHLEGSHQAAKAHVHKVSYVSQETTAAREKKNRSFPILQENREGFLSKEEIRSLDQFFKIRTTQ